MRYIIVDLMSPWFILSRWFEPRFVSLRDDLCEAAALHLCRVAQIDLIQARIIRELPFSGAVRDRELWRESGFEQEHKQLGSRSPCMDEYLFGPGRFVEFLHLRCDGGVPMLQVFVAKRLQLLLPPVALSGRNSAKSSRR